MDLDDEAQFVGHLLAFRVFLHDVAGVLDREFDA
jgi:hypothetical protein